MPSLEKARVRREMIQVLAEAIMDGIVNRYMLMPPNPNPIDLAEPGVLALTFDMMVQNDLAEEWYHFTKILALRPVINEYRKMT